MQSHANQRRQLFEFLRSDDMMESDLLELVRARTRPNRVVRSLSVAAISVRRLDSADETTGFGSNLGRNSNGFGDAALEAGRRRTTACMARCSLV